jgi:hypothetical protein
VRAIVLLKKDLELNAFVQYERWKVPVLAPGLQTDTTGSIQITYYPKLHFGHQ